MRERRTRERERERERARSEERRVSLKGSKSVVAECQCGDMSGRNGGGSGGGSPLR